jgi:hypothetical protein
VERRLHPRYPTSLEATVVELAKGGTSTAAIVTDISASGVRVALDHPLAPGDVIRLDIVDSLFWGHVVHANADGPGFTVGVEIERVLLGGSDLSRLLRGLLEQSSPGVPRVPASG